MPFVGTFHTISKAFRPIVVIFAIRRHLPLVGIFAIRRHLPLVGIMSNTNRSKQINKLFDLDLKSHFNTKQYSTLFDF